MTMMKPVAFPLLLLVCISFPGTPIRAEDTPESKAQVEFDLMVVQLPEPTALPLIRELRDPKTSTAAADKLIGLVARDKASLIAWPVVVTHDKDRAVVEQVDEFRYATEYDSPGRAKVTNSHLGTTESPTAPVVPVDPKTPPQSVDFSGRVTTTLSEFDGIPTSFETRNIGVTLEVEPRITADGKAVELGVVPQHVSLRAMRKAEIELKPGGKKVVVEQPEFVTNKVTTSLTVQDGETTLLGVFHIPEPKGTVELFILHTKIKPLTH